MDRLNDEYQQLIDALSVYEGAIPRFIVTDLVARDLLLSEWKRPSTDDIFDLETGKIEATLPLCTLCDTEIVDDKEVPIDKVLTSDLDFGMRLLFDYALVLDQDPKTPKTLQVKQGSTTI